MTLWGIIKGLLVQDQTDRTKELSLEVDPASTTGKRMTVKSAHTDNRTVTIPDASDTLVGKATADVLTNKTIDADATGNVITNIENENIKAAAAIDASKIADGTVSNTEFQYINTLSSNVQTQIDDHLSDASDAHDASAISSVPAGALSATNVQSALNELDSDLTAHINLATDAHDASAISNIPAGNLAATNVQNALNELDSDLTAHISDSSDAHDASAISNVPSGNLAATDVQAALNELQSDIDVLAPGGGANLQLSNLSGTTDIPVDLIFDKAANRTIRIEDETGSGVGKNLTVKAGQAFGTDQAGGNLILSAGPSTGTGQSKIQFQVPPADANTGSTPITPVTLFTLESNTSGLEDIYTFNRTIATAWGDFQIKRNSLFSSETSLLFTDENTAAAGQNLLIQGSKNAGAGQNGNIRILTANKDVAGATGSINIAVGTASDGAGGNILINTGASSSAFASGYVHMSTGTNTGTGHSGSIQVITGNPSNTGSSGGVTIATGTNISSSGNGGQITIQPGRGQNSSGKILLQTIGSSLTGGAIEVYTSGGSTSTGKIDIATGGGVVGQTTGDIDIKTGGGGVSFTAGDINIVTGDATDNGGFLYLTTGDTSAASSSSGGISLTVGTVGAGGTRGTIEFSGRYFKTNQTPVVGDVSTFASYGTTPTNALPVDGYNIIVIQSTTAITINGITAGVNGQYLTIYNENANNIIFANESGSAAAADRIRTNTGGNLTSTTTSCHTFVYLSSRWVMTGNMV